MKEEKAVMVNIFNIHMGMATYLDLGKVQGSPARFSLYGFKASG
jgi:hypothetical protein